MIRVNALLALALLAAVCAGCVSRLPADARATADLTGSDERDRARALKYFLRMEPVEREQHALAFLLSPEPELAWAGITILSRHEPSAEGWAQIEAAIGPYGIARRYSHIAAAHGRADRLDRLAEAITEAPNHDLAFLLKSIGRIAGAEEPPNPTYTRLLLRNRWGLYTQRCQSGSTDRQLESALTHLYAARRATDLPQAVRMIPKASLALAEADLQSLLTESEPALGRELAIFLGECKGPSAVRLLLLLAASDDYITRFSTAASLESVTGAPVAFDPAASKSERKRALDALYKTLAPEVEQRNPSLP